MNDAILWELKTNIENLLNNVGDKSTCKGYGGQIWWVTHKSGKKAPYTNMAQNHFIDCPQAELFRKNKA